MQAKDLPDDTLDPVTAHRAANESVHTDSQAAVRKIVRQENE